MLLASSVTDDEDTLIACLMHDSLEDVAGYTYEQLSLDCGESVAEIVRGVTEIREPSAVEDRSLRWLAHKESYLKNLRDASVKSALVSTADKAHNLMTLMSNYEREGDEFLKHFSSMKNTLWFNDEVEKIILEKLPADNALVLRFQEELRRAHTLFAM
jgi:(p)ppGpp synthase/HD superfamily hydrolase